MADQRDSNDDGVVMGEVEQLREEVRTLRTRLEAVSESERRYRTLVESAKDFIFILDRSGTVRYVNDFGASAIGMAKDAVVGRSIAELFPSNAARQMESVRHVFATGTPLYVETVTSFPGGRLCLDTWMVPLNDRDGEVELVLGISRDITARKVALDELERRIAFEETIAGISRRFIAVPIEEIDGAMNDAVRVLGEFVGADQCTIRLTSDDGGQMDVAYAWQAPGSGVSIPTPHATPERVPWGFSIIAEQKPLVIAHPSELPLEAARERAMLEETGIQSMAVVPLVYGGSTIGVLVFAMRDSSNERSSQTESLLGVVGEIFTNALVRKRVEEDRARMAGELIRAERLDSIGILAGGIAHDFNNILAAIWGNVSLASAAAAGADSVCSRLDEAEKALARARDLTQQLLTFAKGGSPVKQLVEPASLATESAVFATRGSNVRPSFDIEPDLWAVEADPGQLAQVVHNLVINAVQAMPDGGVVTVSVCNVVLSNGDGVPLAPGRYVRVIVADRGKGIAQEHLSKLFVPYFTTKPAGSGLGLATSYNIVRKHAGLITVDTHPGEGSRFSVFLPASSGVPGSFGSDDALLGVGQGRVLVVDDDESVLGSASAMLAHLGYEPDTAATGEEGIVKYKEAARAGQRYDLVVMDLTIPGSMGGKEAIAKILAFDPDAVAIVSSGYSDDPVMADHLSHGFRGVLKKPYGLRKLGEALHAALHNEDGATSTEPRIMNDRIMSAGEVAKLLGVSASTVKRWTGEGKLRGFRTPGGHRRFQERDINDFASNGGPDSSRKRE